MQSQRRTMHLSLALALSVACYHKYPRPQDIPTGTAENPIQGVAGGLRIRPGEFPYVVALGYSTYDTFDGSQIEYRCSGVLIDERFVLTAAQCLKTIPAVVLPVGLNITAETHRIAHIYVHPDYIEYQLYDDIGLIELQDPIRKFPPACLSDDQLAIGSRLTAMSGYTDNLLTRTVELRKGQIDRILNENRIGHFNAYPIQIHKDIKITQSCDEDEEELPAKCKSDSGGPIMIDTGDNTRPFVVGITSHFVRCSSEFPGFYTRVGPYIDWIESILWRK